MLLEEMEMRVMWRMWVRVGRPVLAEAAESTGRGVAVERGAPEAESALTMKPNGAENWVGPASSRRDNMGAPAMQTYTHTHLESEDKAVEAFS